MKKIINNNIVKVCAFLLLAAGAALPIQAQNPAANQPLVYDGGTQEIKKGDSIRINKDSRYYLTGQRISKWVYDKVHTVQQVGGRRYPNGVLIRGIYSWVYPNTITPLHKMVVDSIAASACGEYYWDATGVTYTESGDYVFEGKTANGTDSVVNLRLTIHPTYNKSVDMTVNSKEYLWDATGVVYTQDGDYTFHGKTEYGCDSLITLHLTFDTIPYADENVSYEIPVPYQMDRFSVGVRGGFASNMAGEKMPLGFDALLDLRYAHYWSADKNKPAFGIMTGLNVGYMQTFQSATIDDKFTLKTDAVPYGDVRYEVSADKVSQTTQQLQLEVPLMFAMFTPKGFFLNAGPKFILPVYSQYKQELVNPTIKAYKDELNGNPIVNEVVMGKVSDEQANYKGNLVETPYKLFSVALGAELGYEFKLKNGHSLDLGVYADYSLISAYKGAEATGKIITITPPSINSAAIVDVQPISSAFSSKYGFLDAGVKISYNFDWVK